MAEERGARGCRRSYAAADCGNRREGALRLPLLVERAGVDAAGQTVGAGIESQASNMGVISSGSLRSSSRKSKRPAWATERR